MMSKREKVIFERAAIDQEIEFLNKTRYVHSIIEKYFKTNAFKILTVYSTEDTVEVGMEMIGYSFLYNYHLTIDRRTEKIVSLSRYQKKFNLL